jgi:hypothetical protein
MKYSSASLVVFPSPKEVKRGEDITVVAGGQTYIFNCTKREELDRQDGTYDLVCSS